MDLPLLFLSVFLAAIIAAGAYLLHALTLSGAVASFFIIAVSLYFGSFSCFTVLVSSFCVIAVIGKLTKKRSAAITAGMHEKEGARDAVQVLVNGAPAALSAILFSLTGETGFLFAYFVAVGESLADSLASDIGVLSKSEPRDILTFRKVTRGTSGGISALRAIPLPRGIFPRGCRLHLSTAPHRLSEEPRGYCFPHRYCFRQLLHFRFR